eukprot:COSAG02_NODE_1729_length_11180_cov_3.283368_5_plen_932_part_00
MDSNRCQMNSLCWAGYDDYSFGPHEDRDSLTMSQFESSCEAIRHEPYVEVRTPSMRQSGPGNTSTLSCMLPVDEGLVCGGQLGNDFGGNPRLPNGTSCGYAPIVLVVTNDRNVSLAFYDGPIAINDTETTAADCQGLCREASQCDFFSYREVAGGIYHCFLKQAYADESCNSVGYTPWPSQEAPGCDFDACLRAARTGYAPYDSFSQSSVATWQCEQGNCITARQFCHEWVQVVRSVCPTTCQLLGSGVVPLHSESFNTQEAAEAACLLRPESCKGIFSEALPHDLCTPSTACGPFISEYHVVECSSTDDFALCNSFFEVYNPTNALIDLGLYAFPHSGANTNGDGIQTTWNNFTAGATIAPGGVYVVCHPNANSSLGRCDQRHHFAQSGNSQCLVRGDEASHSFVDCVGDFTSAGSDGGWGVCGISAATTGHALIRNCGVSSGNAGNWTVGTLTNDCDWIVAPVTAAAPRGDAGTYWSAGGYATHVCRQVWRMSTSSTLVASKYTWSSLCRTEACSHRVASDRQMAESFADGTESAVILSSCCRSDADCAIGQSCNLNTAACTYEHAMPYDVRSTLAEECPIPSIRRNCQVNPECSAQLDRMSSCGPPPDEEPALAPPMDSELRCARQQNAAPFPHSDMDTACQVCEDYSDAASCLACCSQIRGEGALSSCCHGGCCALGKLPSQEEIQCTNQMGINDCNDCNYLNIVLPDGSCCSSTWQTSLYEASAGYAPDSIATCLTCAARIRDEVPVCCRGSACPAPATPEEAQCVPASDDQLVHQCDEIDPASATYCFDYDMNYEDHHLCSSGEMCNWHEPFGDYICKTECYPDDRMACETCWDDPSAQYYNIASGSSALVCDRCCDIIQTVGETCCFGGCCSPQSSDSTGSQCPADSPGNLQLNTLMQCAIEMPNDPTRIADPVRTVQSPCLLG